MVSTTAYRLIYALKDGETVEQEPQLPPTLQSLVDTGTLPEHTNGECPPDTHSSAAQTRRVELAATGARPHRSLGHLGTQAEAVRDT